MSLFEKFKFINFFKAVVANSEGAYRLSKDKLDEIRYEIIKERFRYHYAHNKFYREICENESFFPENLKSFNDIKSIPVIHTSLFKQSESDKLLSCCADEISITLTSTGTDGIPSVSNRDADSVEKGILSVRAEFRELLKINKGTGLYLAPTLSEFPRMGMVRVFNLLKAAFYSSYNLVNDFVFDPEEAVKILKNHMNIEPCYILGPPFLVIRLINHLEENNIKLKLDSESKIITLGGWKRFSGDAIPVSLFRDKCSEFLGIKKAQVRDMYGTAESNILAIEDEDSNLIVPPWSYFSIRDRENPDVEVPDGKTGVVAIYDTVINSYPGFLLTGDIGMVKEKKCADGRFAQVFTFKGRHKTATHGSCAYNMDKYMEQRNTLKNVDYSKFAESKS